MPNIYVQSYGCSANTADKEIIKGTLTLNGYTVTDNPRDSDLNIILTCIVKTPTEQKIKKRIKQLQETGKPMIIAGCMPKAMNSQTTTLAPEASLVGPDDIDRVMEAVAETLNGKRVTYTDGAPSERTCMPRVRENPLIHIQPICTGCLGDCAYCIVKHARGRLYSFPADNITESVQAAVQQGCREVWLTAEDTAAYRSDGVRLPELLNMITALPGDFRVRVGMMTPNQLEPVLGDLIEAYSSPKVYKFIHIPVQAGSDQVLRNMNRRYTVQEFKHIVERLRDAFPDMGVSTDIICGFPGETPGQFRESLDLIEWLRPDVLNISRFWLRPGTEAAELPGRLHGRDTKKRSRVMTELWKRLAVQAGERWLGWEGEILIDEEGRAGSMVGRNYVYKAVAVKGEPRLGEYVTVRVVGAGVGFLEAEIV